MSKLEELKFDEFKQKILDEGYLEVTSKFNPLTGFNDRNGGIVFKCKKMDHYFTGFSNTVRCMECVLIAGEERKNREATKKKEKKEREKQIKINEILEKIKNSDINSQKIERGFVVEGTKLSYKSIIPNGAPKTNNNFKQYCTKDTTTSLKGIVQASSDIIPYNTVDNYIFENNGFLKALHCSYDNHLPFRFGPDDIWLIFMSQLAVLINKDPEKYRKSFVDHEGKENITIRNDSLKLDDTHDPINSENWASVFPLFEDGMNEKMNENVVKNMGSKFSTTTQTSYISSRIVIMDALQSYFSYTVTTFCGIPEVRINGTVDDWEIIKSSIEYLCKNAIFEEDWISGYHKFINEVIKVLQDNGDGDYWNRLYHYKPAGGGSGSTPTISGYVNDLFPLDKDGEKGDKYGEHRSTGYFPGICGSAPFVWNYFGTIYDCLFEAGLKDAFVDTENGFEISPKSTWKIVRKVEKS